MAISFDWAFHASDVITLGSALIVAGGFLYRRGRTDRSLEAVDEAHETRLETAVLMSTSETSALKVEVTAMKDELKQLAVIMTNLAVQETKINLLMKWYDELRRGVGLIDGRSSPS